MIRTFLAVVVLSSIFGLASAGPCDEEAKAAAKAGRDPKLLSPPKGSQAEAHMNEGFTRYAEGLKRSRVVATQATAAVEFQAAIDAYVAAEMASPSPLGLYNLAQTYRAMGDYANAIAQYTKFLESVKPGKPLRRLVECHVASMSAELERAASSAPPAGPESTKPDESTAKAQPSPGSIGSTSEPQPPTLDLQLDEMPTPREPWQADAIGWTISGTGLAVAGVGAFLLLDARSLRAEADDEPREDVRIDLRERADGRQTWGTAATVTGGAILIAGIVKLALRPAPPRRARAEARMRITPMGLALEGSF